MSDSNSAVDNRPHPSTSKEAKRRRREPQTPQQKIDEFWDKFKTKAPGKAISIIPQQSDFSERAAKRASAKSLGPAKTTQQSYEEAAAQCRHKVAQIVKECRRVNQKYRDPHFDLEIDLKICRRDCLDSLDNVRKDALEDDYCREPPLKDRNQPNLASGIMGLLDRADKENSMPADGNSQPRLDPRAVKRVVDIFDDPKFFIDGPTADDVRQGRDGDCWLMAALCTISNKPGLIEKCCVAHDHEVGVYGFVFHRDGEWFSEIIDDKLYLTKPDYDELCYERIMWEDRERVNSEEAYRKIYQSNSGALYFAQCENPNETWLPLLEKAYAKAHGDFSAIEGGYGGEGIEDLTGGVTSEIYTTDILDKEHFWTEELMKVNQEFLFGCSTGVWGRGWGERKGIVELHAYSVLQAREIDGVRLVLLKNPWGKHEWKGAWSDGSKEWTADWIQKLNHKFGDDGSFWISYDDLLKKYQAFDRTRLFDPGWKVASIWTTLHVSWTLDYHDTKFAFSLAKPGPVVIVCSQLDERYFKGLEGQYRFELSFRLHKSGEEDYLVRSQSYYRMNRSVNAELELEAGEYIVVVKIDARRDGRIMPVEDVVRAFANERREKLLRIGFAYDLAHSKGKILECAEEKAAREAHEKRKKDKERNKVAKMITKQREEDRKLAVRQKMKKMKAAEKAKARAKAMDERRQARKQAKENAEEEEGKKKDGETNTSKKEKAGDDNVAPEEVLEDPHGVTKARVYTPLAMGKDAESTEKPAAGNNGALEEDRSTAEGQPATPKRGQSKPQNAEPKPAADKAGEALMSARVDIGVQTGPGLPPPPHRGPVHGRTRGQPHLYHGRLHCPRPEVSSSYGSDASTDNGLNNLDSLSEVSDHEIDLYLEAQDKARAAGAGAAKADPPPSQPPQNGTAYEDEMSEFEKDPWNAAGVFGLRVYYKSDGKDRPEDDEVVKLRVDRPSPYAGEDDSDDEADDEAEKTKGEDGKDAREEANESQVLDIDDSAKDAVAEEVTAEEKKEDRKALGEGKPSAEDT